MNATPTPSLTEQLQARLNAVITSPSGVEQVPVPVPATVTANQSVSSSRSPSGSQDGGQQNGGSKGEKSTSSSGGYRDFSHMFPASSSSLIAQSITTKEPTFPVKLHIILSNPEYQDIISWLPHGRSWRILQQKALEERVIPLYFRHGRYSSFARQVNGWGFRRITHGRDYNSYYHEVSKIYAVLYASRSFWRPRKMKARLD